MGYRNYIGKISKEIYEQNKDLTKKELYLKYEDEGKGDVFDDGDSLKYYFSGDELPTYKMLHNLGKYCDFDIDKETHEFFTKWKCPDTEFLVCTENVLLKIIEDYRLTVLKWYEKQLKTPKEAEHNYRTMVREWGGDKWNMIPYDLDKETDNIVKSWRFEYAIFDLVRIYKSFDWENDVLIYSGH